MGSGSDCSCPSRVPNPGLRHLGFGDGGSNRRRGRPVVPKRTKKVKVKKPKPAESQWRATTPRAPAASTRMPRSVTPIGLAAKVRPTRAALARPVSQWRATDPEEGTSRVAKIAACVAGACSATTSKLRDIVAQQAPKFAATGTRRQLVQGLGLKAAAAAGGDDPGEVMARAGVSLDDIREAALHRPDIAMMIPRYGQALAFERPQGSFAGYERVFLPWVSLNAADGPGGTGPLTPQGGGANPPPVGFRPGNWDLDKCEYTIAPGDTMFGLAKEYLGGVGSRWKEIWSLQPWRYEKCPDPSCTASRGLPMPQVGDKLIMPKEACDKAKAWSKSDDKPALPATPGAPAYDNPAKPDPGRPGGSKGGGGGGGSSKSSLPKWAIPAAIGVAVVGGAALLL